jgi:hypothetical protein
VHADPVSRIGRPLAVLALSGGTLAYEVLLVRVFAIEQFHHFAYLAVGVAMLGFGASGTALAVLQARRPIRPDSWLAAAALATPLALLAVPAATDLLPIDPTRLAWDLGQCARLLILQALLAVPFALGGLGTLAALLAAEDRPGLVYSASFLGAGVGALAAVAVLAWLDPERALALPPLLAVPAGFAVARAAPRPRWWRALAALLLLGAGTSAVRSPWRLELLPYKGLAQVRAFPGARVVAERTSPTGWMVAVAAPAFRFAPGLSLGYRGEFPAQTAVFVDGELAGAVASWSAASRALLDWQPAALPYALGKPRRVLLLTPGGAHEVASALTHDSGEITAVELQPGVAALARRIDIGEGLRGADAPVTWAIGDGRRFLAHTRYRYDLVILGPFAGGGPGAGMVSLREDFLHTVEGYLRCLEALTPGGVLAVTNWLTVPPRAEVRSVLTAAVALRRLGRGDPAAGLVVVRSWGTVTILVKPDGFSPADLDRITRWTAARWFDVDWRPGLAAPRTRFNFVDAPVLFEAARAAVGGEETAAHFTATYPFDVGPATDARPYPHAFLGRRTLRLMLGRSRSDWLPFAEWGYLAVLATLAQGAVLAALLLALPALFVRGRASGERGGPLLWYFGSLGLAYLLAEIAAIQQLTLLLGHPVYAVAAVLAAMLVGSGLGSAWSDRLAPTRARGLTLGLALACGALAVGLLPLVHAVEGAGLGARALTAALVLGPLAAVMGMPFPLGLRRLAGDDTARVAWAWAANGFASVVAAPLAALIALEAGSQAVFGVAAAAYAVAAFVMWSARSTTRKARSATNRS